MRSSDPRKLSPGEFHELDRGLRLLARTLVGEEALSEDLVQQTWMAVLDSPPVPVRDLRRWLRRVLRNRALTSVARTRRRSELERLMATRSAVLAEPQQLEESSVAALLRDTVQQLPAPYREVIEGRFFGDESTADLARRLNRPQATVRTQIRRGVSLLRERLDQRPNGREEWLGGLLVGLAWEPADASERSVLGIGRLVAALALFLGALGIAYLAWPESKQDQLAYLEPEDAASMLEPERVPRDPSQSRVAPATESAPFADAAEEPATRRLEIRVFRRDGSPVHEATIQYRDARREILSEQLRGHPMVLEVQEQHLVNEVRGQGIYVAAWTQDEALSPAALVYLPPEGSRCELVTGGPAHRLAGRVVDESGRPLPGAYLRTELLESGADGATKDGGYQGEFGYAATCDSEGRFEFPRLKAGVHDLVVRQSGFAAKQRSVSVGPDGEELLITLSKGLTLHGQLTYDDGHPVERAEVWVNDLAEGQGFLLIAQQTQTDSEGRFVLEGLRVGASEVFAADAKDPFLYARLSIDEQTPSRWGAVLEDHGGVEVLLRDPQGQPVQGEIVFLQAPRGPRDDAGFAEGRFSDAEGHVFFPHVPDRAMRITTIDRAFGLVELRHEQVLSRPEPYELTIHPPQEPAFLSAALLDSHGAPSQSGDLRCYAKGQTSLQLEGERSSGIIASAPIRPGRYSFQVFYPDLGVHSVGEHELAAGETLDLGHLQPPNPVWVSVTWSAPAPTPTAPWDLRAEPAIPDAAACVVSVVQTTPTRWQLFPGRYLLVSPDGLSQEVAIDSGTQQIAVSDPRVSGKQ